MKAIGFILVTVGFIFAALATVVNRPVIEGLDMEPAQDRNAVESFETTTRSEASSVKWLWYIPALALGAAGVFLIRTTEAKQKQTEHHVAANIETIESSLGRIVTNITRLDADKANINTYDVRHRIDELFTNDLETFVEARESIVHRYGLSAYGEVMTRFASAERYLNRVWSASADGYIDEVNEYLQRAKDQFAESLTLLKTLQAKTPPA